MQTYIHTLFGDTLAGAAVAMVPQTGEVLALYSAPAIDPNRFIGGVSSAYYDSLLKDPRKPLLNKAVPYRGRVMRPPIAAGLLRLPGNFPGCPAAAP